MKNKENGIPVYLYPATSMDCLGSILDDMIHPAKGKRINGYDEDTVSFSDILNNYRVFYGNALIEFFGKRIISKNRIYPDNYEITESDPNFYNMPFGEDEWRGSNVKFTYKDINKIYFLEMPLFSVIETLNTHKIRYKIIPERDLPSFPERCYIQKYIERIAFYKNTEACWDDGV